MSLLQLTAIFASFLLSTNENCIAALGGHVVPYGPGKTLPAEASIAYGNLAAIARTRNTKTAAEKM